jgi:AcrR family transcriptional regulator
VSTVSPASGLLRREPRQARSRARLAQILAAADAILTTEGVEALTIRRIAERAGVSVGTLYQFFPDKGSVVDAVARAYIEEFDALVEELVSSAASGDWSDPVGRIVDSFVALYRSHPGYVALWSGRHLSAELARADEANNQLIAAGVRQVLASHAGVADADGVAAGVTDGVAAGVAAGPRLELAARVAVRTADALLQYAFSLSPDGDEAVLAELKDLLRLYLASLR